MSDLFRLRHAGASPKAIRLCLPSGEGVSVPVRGCYPPMSDPPISEMTSQMRGLVDNGALRKEPVRVPPPVNLPPTDHQE